MNNRSPKTKTRHPLWHTRKYSMYGKHNTNTNTNTKSTTLSPDNKDKLRERIQNRLKRMNSGAGNKSSSFSSNSNSNKITLADEESKSIRILVENSNLFQSPYSTLSNPRNDFLPDEISLNGVPTNGTNSSNIQDFLNNTRFSFDSIDGDQGLDLNLNHSKHEMAIQFIKSFENRLSDKNFTFSSVSQDVIKQGDIMDFDEYLKFLKANPVKRERIQIKTVIDNMKRESNKVDQYRTAALELKSYTNYDDFVTTKSLNELLDLRAYKMKLLETIEKDVIAIDQAINEMKQASESEYASTPES